MKSVLLAVSIAVLGSLAWWSVGFARDHSHDQFLLRYTGVTFRLNPLEQAEQALSALGCATALDRLSCYQKRIDAANREEGSEAAFGLVAYLYNAQPLFAEHCWQPLYGLGAGAYAEFKSGGQPFATIRTKYCSYAYFAGLLDSFRTASDLGSAAAFCTDFNARLAPQESLLSSCFHGLGEGAVFGHFQQASSSPPNLLSAGLESCRAIGKTEAQLEDCAGGAFNAVATLLNKGQFSELDRSHPLALCQAQREAYFQRPCYRMFKYILLKAGSGDLARASGYLDSIADDRSAAAAMYDLASVATRNEKMPDALAQDCQNVQLRLRDACAQGAAAGLMIHGAPEQEYQAVLELCSAPALSDSQRRSCYAQLFWMSGKRYPAQTVARICAQVPAAYRNSSICG